MHERDPVAVLVGLVHVVRGDQHGHAGRPAYLLDALPHAVARHRVQADRRFVEDEEPRGADQRLGELQPADHAAGVGLRAPLGRVLQLHGGQHVAYALLPLAPRHVEEAGEQLDVLAPGQGPVGGQLLRQVADRAADGHPVTRHVEAEDLDHAGPGREEGGDQPDRRRLPGAVRPEEPEDLSFDDVQVDVVDRHGTAERVPQPPADDRIPLVTHGSPRLRWSFGSGSPRPARRVPAGSRGGGRARAGPRRSPSGPPPPAPRCARRPSGPGGHASRSGAAARPA